MNKRLHFFLCYLILPCIVFITITISPSLVRAGAPLIPITTCEELEIIGEDVEYPLDGEYGLETSLDCTVSGNDIMIGDSDNPFSGFFNGDNGTITISLDVNASDGDSIGLFRVIEEGVVTDLNVVGTIVAEDVYNVGMLAGDVRDSSISEISVVADIEMTRIDEESSFSNIGGVVGSFYSSEAENIESSGTVTTEARDVGGVFGSLGCGSDILDAHSSVDVVGFENVGGFGGHDGCKGPGSTIVNASATGDVSGTETVGGFVGGADWVMYENVRAEGNVSGEITVGGLIGGYNGYGQDGKIFHSHAEGNVEGILGVGGLIGYADEGIVSQSYSLGTVTVNDLDGEVAGGFIGAAELMIIRDSYTRSAVQAVSSPTGGFIGVSFDTRISRSYAANSIEVMDDSEVGGFLGDYVGGLSIINSFFDSELSGFENGCGVGDCSVTPADTEEMKDASTFTDAGWNFSGVWVIDETENNGYPLLFGGEDVEFGEDFDDEVEEDIAEFRFVKWEITKIRDIGDCGGGEQACVQAGEIQFLLRGSLLDLSEETIENPGGSGPVEEGVENLTDNDETTKWLDHNFGEGNTDQLGSSVVVIDMGDGNELEFGRYRILTANDEPGRDPIGWELSGSNDGENWTLLDERIDEEDVPEGREEFTYFYALGAYEADDDGDDDGDDEPVVEEESRSRRSGSRKKAVSINNSSQAASVVLNTAVTALPPTQKPNLPVRDLELSLFGDDVKVLQDILISLNKGPSAAGLAQVGATGYFGPLTRAALAEYQASVGIVPSIGYFGPLTQAHMKTTGAQGLWW